VQRTDPRKDFQTVMNEGKNKLSKGISMVIFPQSTRRAEFVPGEFNKLGVKLARAAGIKVVPVAVKTDFWQNGRLVKDMGPIYRDRPIYIEFGESIDVHGSGKEENRLIMDFIASRLEKWGGKILRDAAPESSDL
jgi:1-acyl-sn-glycerol-3-phosphate acyltransferase